MIRTAAALLLLLLLSAPAASETPLVMTTIPPLADILRSIAGERADVVGLLPAGASPHTFEPRPSDLVAADRALLLVYVDERLDGWAAGLPGPPKLALMPLVPDTLVLDMGRGAADDHHDHGRDAGGHHHGPGPDPHFWTDPLVVREIAPRIAEKLGDADPEGRAVYLENAASLAAELDSLHRSIGRKTAHLRGEAVFLSHPFLQYYLHRYGIKVAAVIERIPGKEPTAKEITGLIRLARVREVRAVLTLPQLSQRGAEIVSESTGLPVVVVDPLGGVPGLVGYDELLLEITRRVAE